MHHPPFLATLTVTTLHVSPFLLVPVLSSRSPEYSHKQNPPPSMSEIRTMNREHRKSFVLIYCWWLVGWEGFVLAIIIRGTNWRRTLMSIWVQEVRVMANKGLTDWYNVKASFCITDPAKCKRWGWVTMGGGASSWMVRGHWWNRCGTKKRVNVTEDEHLKMTDHKLDCWSTGQSQPALKLVFHAKPHNHRTVVLSWCASHLGNLTGLMTLFENDTIYPNRVGLLTALSRLRIIIRQQHSNLI